MVEYSLVTISLNKPVDPDDLFTPKPTSGITISGLNASTKVKVPVFFYKFIDELGIVFLN